MSSIFWASKWMSIGLSDFFSLPATLMPCPVFHQFLTAPLVILTLLSVFLNQSCRTTNKKETCFFIKWVITSLLFISNIFRALCNMIDHMPVNLLLLLAFWELRRVCACARVCVCWGRGGDGRRSRRSYYSLSAHCVWGTVLRASTHLTLTATLWLLTHHHHHHFKDEDPGTEALSSLPKETHLS